MLCCPLPKELASSGRLASSCLACLGGGWYLSSRIRRIVSCLLLHYSNPGRSGQLDKSGSCSCLGPMPGCDSSSRVTCSTSRKTARQSFCCGYPRGGLSPPPAWELAASSSRSSLAALASWTRSSNWSISSLSLSVSRIHEVLSHSRGLCHMAQPGHAPTPVQPAQSRPLPRDRGPPKAQLASSTKTLDLSLKRVAHALAFISQDCRQLTTLALAFYHAASSL